MQIRDNKEYQFGLEWRLAKAAMQEIDQDMVISRSAEGIVVGAVDAGIAVNALQTAAESFGYDADLRQWWDNIGMKEMPSYTAQTAQFYSKIYFPQVAKTLELQGFVFTDKE